MRQRITKDTIEFILCWFYCWAQGQSLLVFPVRFPRRKLFFFVFEWLSSGDSFGITNGDLCPFLFSVLGPHLTQAHESSVHFDTVSVSYYAHRSCCSKKVCFLGILQPLCLLHSFHLLFCKVSLAFTRGIDGDILFRMKA